MSKSTADALAAMQAITARVLRETALALAKQNVLTAALRAIIVGK